ncbi:hypothetical protein TELCIR_18058 [Teladorsagia circumcincta]|uniref:Uncharacterized protein n=1 Tax=Teladorsagia circumcincta TaxID=45464 RepID=A0A2G9TR28_TELCI|nr:hypothetical protein TELCIR_18058 [Teladorsagia circumcincta]
MATVAATYGKLGDYQNFTRSALKGPRSSSSNIDSRAKRIAEQENIHQLLQQCRTSQRGAACQSQEEEEFDCHNEDMFDDL